MSDQQDQQLQAEVITVRTLVPADRGEWERLFRGYIDFYERNVEDAEYDRAWRRLLEDREFHGLVATVDDLPLGIVHFLTHAHTYSSNACYLRDLFTDRDARGRGVGKALIEAVTDWARDQGCERVYWQTHVDNERARRLYDQVAEHRGFIVYQIQL